MAKLQDLFHNAYLKKHSKDNLIPKKKESFLESYRKKFVKRAEENIQTRQKVAEMVIE